MDANDYSRVAAILRQEGQAMRSIAATLRSHSIGDSWRGQSRRAAEGSLADTIDECHRAIEIIDGAEREARLLWRRALQTPNILGG